MRVNILLLILGMTFVTYIPRVMPFYIIEKLKLSENTKKFLEYIPYAALGALIFPDSLKAVSEIPQASIAGTLAAFILAYFTKNMFVVVVISIITTYGTIVLLG